MTIIHGNIKFPLNVVIVLKPKLRTSLRMMRRRLWTSSIIFHIISSLLFIVIQFTSYFTSLLCKRQSFRLKYHDFIRIIYCQRNTHFKIVSNWGRALMWLDVIGIKLVGIKLFMLMFILCLCHWMKDISFSSQLGI